MSVKGHLVLHRSSIPPGNEWTPPSAPWVMIFLEEGVGYWIDARSRLELNQSDALLLGENTRGLVRASQLAELELAWFTVNPDALGGFLSLAERHFLNTQQGLLAAAPQHFPARHGVAAEFSRLEVTPDHGVPLLQRCQLLYLFAAALQSRWGNLPVPQAGGQAEKRFQELIAGFSEQELMRFTPRELAARCGCSPRHFARLFQAHFGCSVREKLTELRLRKARELLLMSQSTVAGVAIATGFRHVGLFNAVFKKHFGATPRRWREQHATDEVMR